MLFQPRLANFPIPHIIRRPGTGDMYLYRRCGRSSGVERNLAKVEVVSSNLIARSILSMTHTLSRRYRPMSPRSKIRP